MEDVLRSGEETWEGPVSHEAGAPCCPGASYPATGSEDEAFTSDQQPTDG